MNFFRFGFSPFFFLGRFSVAGGSLLYGYRAAVQGEMIDGMIKEGKIVPGSITLDLLRKAIEGSDKPGILIDGFPRKLDQAGSFEATVSDFEFVLFFDCPEDIMEKR